MGIKIVLEVVDKGSAVVKKFETTVDGSTKGINNDFDKMAKTFKKFGRTAVDSTKKADDSFGEMGKSWGSNVTAMNQGFQLFKSALGEMTSAISEIGGMAERGQVFEKMNDSFSKLAGTVGASSDSILTSVRSATNGMVDDFTIMQQSNQAILLGLPVTASEMGELARVATTLGQAVGRDAVTSLSDLILALGRSSPMILDNLGLTVKMSEATAFMAKKLGKAASQLTETERKQAFYIAALEKGRKKAKELGDVTTNVYQKISAATRNAKDTTAGYLNTLVKATGQTGEFVGVAGSLAIEFGNMAAPLAMIVVAMPTMASSFGAMKLAIAGMPLVLGAVSVALAAISGYAFGNLLTELVPALKELTTLQEFFSAFMNKEATVQGGTLSILTGELKKVENAMAGVRGEKEKAIWMYGEEAGAVDELARKLDVFGKKKEAIEFRISKMNERKKIEVKALTVEQGKLNEAFSLEIENMMGLGKIIPKITKATKKNTGEVKKNTGEVKKNTGEVKKNADAVNKSGRAAKKTAEEFGNWGLVMGRTSSVIGSHMELITNRAKELSVSVDITDKEFSDSMDSMGTSAKDMSDKVNDSVSDVETRTKSAWQTMGDSFADDFVNRLQEGSSSLRGMFKDSFKGIIADWKSDVIGQLAGSLKGAISGIFTGKGTGGFGDILGGGFFDQITGLFGGGGKRGATTGGTSIGGWAGQAASGIGSGTGIGSAATGGGGGISGLIGTAMPWIAGIRLVTSLFKKKGTRTPQGDALEQMGNMVVAARGSRSDTNLQAVADQTYNLLSQGILQGAFGMTGYTEILHNEFQDLGKYLKASKNKYGQSPEELANALGIPIMHNGGVTQQKGLYLLDKNEQITPLASKRQKTALTVVVNINSMVTDAVSMSRFVAGSQFTKALNDAITANKDIRKVIQGAMA